MPYITAERRVDIDRGDRPANSGELNYCLTRLIHAYLCDRGMNYAAMNDIVGALDGAKVEFQRRIVAPYEDTKIRLNGDVTP